ncbi:hypothetical protein SAMN05428970_1054 [Agromyces sp. CF514]|uniref:hypothetical protein n=1 Tax=Agromyces sp. CF514 TaxID=1881031 RepID=UPI0008ED6AF4|nr:hypothetical protein [Agromyces sp. CF514]SFR70847.1 hypothetical protein SAMN05428970_1054 [Agromyces sp. CF514]
MNADDRHAASVRPAVHDRRGRLLAEVRDSAARRRPARLLAQWTDDPLVAVSPVGLRTSVALDAIALDAASGYDALLLSPVAPLGSTSVLAPTSQDRVLSTIRPVEVVSDPTNVLALEAASRMRRAPGAEARLCTLHQTLRMQPVGRAAGHTAHFRLFALADAGRARPDDGFEVDAVLAHLDVYRTLLEAAASAGLGAGSAPRAIVRTSSGGRHTVGDRDALGDRESLGDRDVLGDRVAAAIVARWPDVEVVREPLAGTYYDGLRVGFGVCTDDGTFVELVDIGRFGWVGELTADRRNRFVASAIGIQLIPLLLG